jgi:hypothetical protein
MDRHRASSRAFSRRSLESFLPSGRERFDRFGGWQSRPVEPREKHAVSIERLRSGKAATERAGAPRDSGLAGRARRNRDSDEDRRQIGGRVGASASHGFDPAVEGAPFPSPEGHGIPHGALL